MKTPNCLKKPPNIIAGLVLCYIIFKAYIRRKY